MKPISLKAIRLLRNLGWSHKRIGLRVGFSESRIEQLCKQHSFKRWGETPTCPHCGIDITAERR